MKEDARLCCWNLKFCRDLDLAVKASEDARRSTRLRLQPLRKPKTSQKKKPAKLHGKMPKKPPTAFFYFL